MIVVKLYGGLGNQLFQWAFGIAIAKKRGTSVKFDITSFETDELRNFELSQIIPNFQAATEDEIIQAKGEKNLLTKLIRKVNTTLLPYAKRKLIFEPSFLYSDQIHNHTNATYYEGYWQNEVYFKSDRDLIADQINLEPFLDEKWVEKMRLGTAASLHVRRGDYVTNASVNSSFGLTPMEYYKKAIDLMLNKHSETTFFIFSDDISWCKEAFTFLEKKYFIDDTATAFSDFILMQKCDHHIIANSSFSWWAAWLNENKEKMVIAPEKWFLNSRFDYREIVPENWIKV